jgi:hypothetical protein
MMFLKKKLSIRNRMQPVNSRINGPISSETATEKEEEEE